MSMILIALSVFADRCVPIKFFITSRPGDPRHRWVSWDSDRSMKYTSALALIAFIRYLAEGYSHFYSFGGERGGLFAYSRDLRVQVLAVK